jgi:hypothetical protein
VEEAPIAIRVCVVTETYPPEINGVAMTLSRLEDGLHARGHAVSLAVVGGRVVYLMWAHNVWLAVGRRPSA